MFTCLYGFLFLQILCVCSGSSDVGCAGTTTSEEATTMQCVRAGGGEERTSKRKYYIMCTQTHGTCTLRLRDT